MEYAVQFDVKITDGVCTVLETHSGFDGRDYYLNDSSQLYIDIPVSEKKEPDPRVRHLFTSLLQGFRDPEAIFSGEITPRVCAERRGMV